MMRGDSPLIVGAGPVGLGAALFLARQGHAPRVVERLDEPAQQSKALAVNPRTLEILETTGLTRRMLELGLPIYGAQFHRRGKIMGSLSFTGLHPRYPFMLALSQATTERLLAEALAAAGGGVERGLQMVGCRSHSDGVEVTLAPSAGGPREVTRCRWLLAADGAHSTARAQLGIDFLGSSFPGEWYLADVPLRTALPEDQAHVFFLEDGAFLFLLRVVDDRQKAQPGEPVWRVLGNRPEPLSQLAQAEPTGPPLWTSSFRISHRIAATLATGGVYLAGDAAHIHSPMGARGMNLGLEDAWVFAELVRANRLAEYGRRRRPVDRRVVRQVDLLSRVAAAESRIYRFARAYLFPLAIRIPFIRARMVATVTGLDHKLPQVQPARASRQRPPSRAEQEAAHGRGGLA
jgi:2-polyprenyl-6-methoxyphenol hydroxylase-like FAD-dependent oxidoreductase